MKKVVVWIVAFALPPVLLIAVWLIARAVYPEELREVWTSVSALGFSVVGLASYYFKGAKLFYNWLLDVFYYDLSILQNKKDLEKQKINVFWVDDEFVSKNKVDDEFVSENKDLDAALIVLRRIYNSVVATPSVPANDALLNNYHILIFDVDGVSQEGNRYDALGIATSLYHENPYRVFLICSGRYSCPPALLDVCRGKFIRKGENIPNNVQSYGGILSKPKIFWVEKVEPYLRGRGLDDKSIEEIKRAYIKDWKMSYASRNVMLHQLNLYALSQKDKYRDLNLLDLCKYVLL